MRIFDERFGSGWYGCGGANGKTGSRGTRGEVGEDGRSRGLRVHVDVRVVRKGRQAAMGRREGGDAEHGGGTTPPQRGDQKGHDKSTMGRRYTGSADVLGVQGHAKVSRLCASFPNTCTIPYSTRRYLRFSSQIRDDDWMQLEPAGTGNGNVTRVFRPLMQVLLYRSSVL